MDLRKSLVFALTAVLALTAGCGGKKNDNLGGLDNAGASTVAPPLGTASVTGKVVLKGKIPVEPLIDMASDMTCRSRHSKAVREQAVVADAKGDLANVFVYVKDGAGDYPPPSMPVTLSQKGCMYHPHVFGIQVGQPLEIVNDDPTLHNVHCLAVLNDAFNVGQPTEGMATREKFTKPEVLVKFKCDVHSWMHCYAGVVANPFYSVTGKDGAFKISRLPAGTYTLVAVQEKYGESKPQTVTIKKGETRKMNFTFEAR